ncbi:MAG: hypothetical protein QW728_05765, partial [Thermoplasmata archaeon]
TDANIATNLANGVLTFTITPDNQTAARINVSQTKTFYLTARIDTTAGIGNSYYVEYNASGMTGSGNYFTALDEAGGNPDAVATIAETTAVQTTTFIIAIPEFSFSNLAAFSLLPAVLVLKCIKIWRRRSTIERILQKTIRR